MKQLGSMEDFRWCKAEGCGSGQLHEGGDSAQIVICFKCKAKSCYLHDVPWHYGETCEEFGKKVKEDDQTMENYFL